MNTILMYSFARSLRLSSGSFDLSKNNALACTFRMVTLASCTHLVPIRRGTENSHVGPTATSILQQQW